MLALRPLAVVWLAAGLAGGCETPSITVPFSGTMTVPGCDPAVSACDPLTSLPECPGVSELDVRELSAFREAGEALRRVGEAELTSLSLTITAGAADFGWLDRIEVLAGGDGIPPVTVAALALDAEARASRRIALVPTGAALEEAVRGGPLLVTTRVEGRSPPVDTGLDLDGVLAISFGP